MNFYSFEFMRLTAVAQALLPVVAGLFDPRQM